MRLEKKELFALCEQIGKRVGKFWNYETKNANGAEMVHLHLRVFIHFLWNHVSWLKFSLNDLSFNHKNSKSKDIFSRCEKIRVLGETSCVNFLRSAYNDNR